MKSIEELFKKLHSGEPKKEKKPEKRLPDFVKYSERYKLSLAAERSAAHFMEKKYGFSEDEARTLVYYMDHLNLKPGDIINKKILDVGSGFGEFKIALKKLGKASDAVINFDEKNYFGEADVRGNAESLPFEDNSFDLVIAHCAVPIMQATFRNYEAIARTLREMVRVVKRDGAVKVFPVAVVNHSQETFRKEYLRMGSIVLEELDKIHQEDKDIKIKITEFQPLGDNYNDTDYAWVLELIK